MPSERPPRRAPPWQDALRRWLLVVWFVVGACAILLIDIQGNRIDLEVDEISPIDVRAPHAIIFASAYLTDQERQRAQEAVAPVYEPPDARVRRDQMAQARELLTLISTLRRDATTTPVPATASALAAFALDPAVITTTLAIDDAAWARVKAEVTPVLDRALREEIREDQLAVKRRQVPTLIGLDLSDEESALTIALVQHLMRANSRYNAEKTAEARETAAARVVPVTVSIQKGETILRAGDRVRLEDIESLEALDLRQSDWSWPAALRTASIVALLGLLLGLYATRIVPDFWWRRRQAPIFLALVLLFTLGARWMIPAHAVQPYLFPAAALTMLVSVLLDMRLTTVTLLYTTLLTAFLTQGALDLILYTAAGSLTGMLVLGRGDRISLFLLAGVAVSAVNLVIIALFHLVERSLDWTGMMQLAVAAIINGTLAGSLTLLGVYLLSPFLGVVTSLQLSELGRPTHPLLRQLVLRAPGTYHHTLIVSNLAEQAAQAIGADANLTRVGAYYHDVGKMVRPFFFIENRVGDVNPHDHLDPVTSAGIIKNHITDGLELARKYRLPARIQDFIVEHHGTSLVIFFYRAACAQATPEQPVQEGDFRYPGPRPQSRETAVLMLADVCEAVVRSQHPRSPDELEASVRHMIERRVLEGELNESQLTLHDLDLIAQAFVRVLQGVNHPRVTYPDPLPIEANVPPSVPTGSPPTPGGNPT